MVKLLLNTRFVKTLLNLPEHSKPLASSMGSILEVLLEGPYLPGHLKQLALSDIQNTFEDIGNNFHHFADSVSVL